MPMGDKKKRPVQPSTDLESARLERRIQFLKREANMSPRYRNQIMRELEQLKVKGKSMGIKRYPRTPPPTGVK